MQSTQPFNNVERLGQVYHRILMALGISSQTHPTAADRLSALRQRPYDELLKAVSEVGAGFSWTIVTEAGPAAIWTQHTEALVRSGRLNPHIDAIVFGMMKEEGNLFVKTFPIMGIKDVAGLMGLMSFWPEAQQARLRDSYGVVGDGAGQEADIATITSNALFYAPIEHFADNLTASTKVPVYAYQIDATVGRIHRRAGIGPA